MKVWLSLLVFYFGISHAEDRHFLDSILIQDPIPINSSVVVHIEDDWRWSDLFFYQISKLFHSSHLTQQVLLATRVQWENFSPKSGSTSHVFLKGQGDLVDGFSPQQLSQDVFLCEDNNICGTQSLDLRSRVFFVGNKSESSVGTHRGLALNEVYRPCSTCELQSQRVAWNEVFTMDNIWTRRKDLSQLTFRVCVEHSPPLQIVPTDGSRPTGMFPDLFYELQNIMKFKIIVVHPPDGKWGGITKNGSWNGMIGQLVRGEADMAMSEFTINEDRQKVVDYSIPLMDDSVHFSLLRSSEGTSWLLFLNTFSYEFWASVAASLLITFIVLRFVMFKAQETIKEGSIFGATLLIFLSQSQFSFDFGSKSARILFLASSVLGTIIFTAFSASLTSQFTVEQQSLPLESLEELVQHPEFEFGVQKSSSYETYFSSGVPGSLRHQIYEEFIRSRPENYVQDNKDGFQRSMEDAQFIYLVKKTTYVNSDVICRIVQSPRAIYKIQKAFVFQKDSPYTELFNYNIKNLVEMGGLNRLKRNFMKPLDLSLCGQQETIELGYEKVFTAFLPLVIGVVLSVLILISEVCFVRIVYVII